MKPFNVPLVVAMGQQQLSGCTAPELLVKPFNVPLGVATAACRLHCSGLACEAI